MFYANRDNVDETYIFRLGTIYGFNHCMKFEGVVHKFLFDTIVTEKISIDGSGKQHRPFIHVKSVAHFIQSVIAGKIKSGEIQNLFIEILSVGKVAERLKTSFPSLEIIYVNQDHKFGNLLLGENDITKTLLENSAKGLNVENFFSQYFNN